MLDRRTFAKSAAATVLTQGYWAKVHADGAEAMRKGGEVRVGKEAENGAVRPMLMAGPTRSSKAS